MRLRHRLGSATRPPADATVDRIEARTRAILAADERHGLALAIVVRTVLLLSAMLWLAVDLPVVGLAHLFNLGLVALFVVLGLVERRLLARPGASGRVPYAMALLDCVLFGIVLLLPNPWLEQQFPPTVHLDGSTVLWLLLLLVQRTFALQPLLVLWTGLAAVFGWGLVLLAAIIQAGTSWGMPHVDPGGGYAAREAIMAAIYDPAYVNVAKWLTEAVLVLLVAAGLAAATQRFRRVVIARAVAERGRANLARYFSPNIVDRLAARDQPLGPPQRLEMAVLFADIEGFTRLAETLPAEAVMELLRGFFGRMPPPLSEKPSCSLMAARWRNSSATP